MSTLTYADQKELTDRGIGTVVDLRLPRELELAPNVFAQSQDVVYHHLDLWGDRLEGFKSNPSSIGQAEKLSELYCVGLASCREIIGEILRTLASTGDHASIFHCSAGKDRTGLIAAFLLGIAGVTDEAIAADYALSEVYLDDPYRDHSAPAMTILDVDDEDRDPEADLLPIYFRSCLPETMSRTLAFLDDSFGGIESYARDAGLEDDHIHRLRSRLRD